MKLLITGACGFVGSHLAHELLSLKHGLEILGLDNLIRPGSETNRDYLSQLGVKFIYGDIRATSDLELLPSVDWVVDAAANPSVLAGIDGRSSRRQVIEHNLLGTLNLLEYCHRHNAGLLLLSTSRVYSIRALSELSIEKTESRYNLAPLGKASDGISSLGITEGFSVAAPISLYGATKLASEILALEYSESFDLPVWINRCGVIAGAGQFGRADQGIVAYWINAYLRRTDLRYLGFDGSGRQVRDALHPGDLASLIIRQLEATNASGRPRTVNVGGGLNNSFSLAELSKWCAERFGFEQAVQKDATVRPFDLPWVVMDNSLAQETWKWTPTIGLPEIFEEVAVHAEAHPEWLRLSAPLS